jgi:hypothetical protein
MSADLHTWFPLAQVYVHATCATDTNNISFVMESVFDIILKENLRKLVRRPCAAPHSSKRAPPPNKCRARGRRRRRLGTTSLRI